MNSLISLRVFLSLVGEVIHANVSSGFKIITLDSNSNVKPMTEKIYENAGYILRPSRGKTLMVKYSQAHSKYPSWAENK